jgi:hypothetical protein
MFVKVVGPENGSMSMIRAAILKQNCISGASTVFKDTTVSI